MKNKYIFAFIFAMFIFSSCEKDVLNKGPLDAVDENLVWTDPGLAQLFVNDLYNSIPGGLWRQVDDASDVSEAAHSWLAAIFYNIGDVTPSNSPFECWGLYNQIRSTNVFLENAAPKEANAAAFNTIKGEAIFLRAYFYAELVRFYGGVPIITKPQKLTDNLSVSRNTYDECITYISDEMDKAAALLPDSWEGNMVGHATKGAALAIKARMLLYAASSLNNPSNDQVKWQKAADANKAVIDLETYSLYDKGYSKLFLDDNNQEVIFDIQLGYPYRIMNYEYRNNPTGLNGAYGMTRPTQDFIDMYEMANGKAISDPASGYDPNNPYEGRDPRFYASILYNNVEWRGGTVETFVNGLYGPNGINTYGTDAAMTGYYLKKYLDQTRSMDKEQANWILIRYAEILLNYAETQIALGNEDEARTYINMVRERVGMPATTATGTDLINLYRNERTIELSFEEQRFFDVRRWKIADVALNHPVHKMTITKNDDGTFSYLVEEMEDRVFTDKFYRAPIPQSETQKNKNLIQNPGY